MPSQPQRIRAARVRFPHGAEAAEGVYDCMSPPNNQLPFIEFPSTSPAITLYSTRVLPNLTSPSTDVLQDGPAVLRRLCQRLHHQVSHQPGRAMCDALCGQASEGLRPAAGALPGAECRHDAEWPGPWSVNNREIQHIRVAESNLAWRKKQSLRHRMARAACLADLREPARGLQRSTVSFLRLRTNKRSRARLPFMYHRKTEGNGAFLFPRSPKYKSGIALDVDQDRLTVYPCTVLAWVSPIGLCLANSAKLETKYDPLNLQASYGFPLELKPGKHCPIWPS